MVLLLDVESEDDDPTRQTGSYAHDTVSHAVSSLPPRSPQCVEATAANESNRFVQSLACYPIAVRLAHSLDLTDIHELSRTCRHVRDSLLTLRTSMIAHAMRCHNDPSTRPKSHMNAATTSITTTVGRFTPPPTLTTVARIGPCARDMVGECRRCGVVVCRNCIAKPPSPAALKLRHRRLCKTCLKCPLSTLKTSSAPIGNADDTEDPHTGSGTHRSPCTCAQVVWICRPCGQTLRTLDVQYVRVWTWRERYSTYLGGMGTGIGEGLEGEECGRKTACLAAQYVEKEIECDATELAADAVESERAKLLGRTWGGTSYCLQEMEGLGGILKKKVRRRVRVGRVVKEYEDERMQGTWLSREQTGLSRSWCSWCDRVVPSNKDTGASRVHGHALEHASSSSSSLSSS